MSDRRVSALKGLGRQIKRSPKIVRKVIGSATQRLKVGKGKGFSDLKGCQDNGWLYKDEDVAAGINYQVKYLGSVEVDFDPSSSSNNQEHAQKAMRALRAHTKQQGGKLPRMILRVSISNIQLHTIDTCKTIMRHSTTRIAYSTVDVDKPKLFAYVAMVKDSRLTLCHIFKCLTPKQGYEMTFVCAQAFDLNYRNWQQCKEKALEGRQDIEPEKAWQKKKTGNESPLSGRKQPAEKKPSPMNTPVSSGPSSALGRQPSEVSEDDRQLPASRSAEDAKRINPPARDPIFLAIMEGQDPAKLAEDYFGKIGVNMIEDDDESETDAAFTALAQSRANSLAPNMLEVGVDTESYNRQSSDDNVGYVTVGPIGDNFSAQDDDSDGYESD
eukprot:m.337100 g.337100  ORF g.337100 m.337100 type:complete len:384 (+) comp18046_c0_seq1:134-1285(+)